MALNKFRAIGASVIFLLALAALAPMGAALSRDSTNSMRAPTILAKGSFSA